MAELSLQQLRFHYAGAVGLLAECAVHLSNSEESADLRDSIARALDDWCKMTGWSYKQVINRFELIPPRSTPMHDDETYDYEDDKINEIYMQRNMAAIALAKVALVAGWKAGRGRDSNESWEDCWRNVVYIEFPNGKQVSWHVSPDIARSESFLSLPQFEGSWDGTYLGREFDWPLKMGV